MDMEKIENLTFDVVKKLSTSEKKYDIKDVLSIMC